MAAAAAHKQLLPTKCSFCVSAPKSSWLRWVWSLPATGSASERTQDGRAVRAWCQRPSCLRAAVIRHPGQERATFPLLHLQPLPTAITSSQEWGSSEADGISGTPEANKGRGGQQQCCQEDVVQRRSCSIAPSRRGGGSRAVWDEEQQGQGLSCELRAAAVLRGQGGLPPFPRVTENQPPRPSDNIILFIFL